MIYFGAASAAASPQSDTEAPTQTESAVIYRSPEERREAGLGTQLTEWLSFSGLAEFGAEYQSNIFQGGISNADSHETWGFVQLGFEITLSEQISAELLLISDLESYVELDEGLVNFATETWSISAGRQYVPFGQYYSHFIIDPLLTFSLTRATALSFYYAFEDVLNLSLYVFDGGDGTLDWGLGLGFSSIDEMLTVGIGYLSDLTRANKSSFEDFDAVHQNRVAGLNANVLVAMDSLAITAEFVKALRSFEDIEGNWNAPLAWNVELAWFSRPFLVLAARMEGSDGLRSEPARQYGLTATWRIQKRFTLTADYLFGEFTGGLVFDENDNELDSRHQVVVQLSMEF
jgi:hypothetical protein